MKRQTRSLVIAASACLRSVVLSAVGLAALACLLADPVRAGITYEMVTVGNAGNGTDTGGTGKGAVAYSYWIGKYDVTIGQYRAFLNAVDPTGTNPNGIWNSQMQSNLNIAGISYNSLATDGSKYSVMNNGGDSGNRPITYVSWFDAARFANWMTNGQGGPGTTETGAYTLVGGQTSGNAVVANPGAAFRLPTENEWYKAAYYDPTLNGGSGGYYAYATKSNNAPDNQIGSTANQANYIAGGVYSVTQSPSLSPSQNYLTDVGAFTGSGSFYGTFDQNGNVNQWNDLDGTAGSSRGLLGGSWAYSNSYFLSSTNRFENVASDEDDRIGFRLASLVASGVPEIDPATGGSALSLITGVLAMIEQRRRRATPVA
jgi:sulfatase modifying factor 1